MSEWPSRDLDVSVSSAAVAADSPVPLISEICENKIEFWIFVSKSMGIDLT